jgi:hypothetical protein
MNYRYNQPKFNYIEAKPVIKKIHDKKGTNMYGILLMNQQNLDNIRKQSGPLANECEYQAHYINLNVRIKMPTATNPVSVEYLDIQIPLVYYNYSTEVSGSRVSFHLKDVSDAALIAKPLADIAFNRLFEHPQSLGSRLNELFSKAGLNPEYTQQSMSVLHRHPGNMHRFSGGDLDTDHTNPGVCFPLLKADKEPVFSSIITHKNDGVILGHTEYRIADGNVESDNGIIYYHGKSITLVKGYQPEDTRTKLQTILGFKKTNKIESYTVSDGLPEGELVQSINKIFNESDYIAFDDTVLAENVKEKKYTPYKYTKTASAKKKSDTAQSNKIIYTDKTTKENYTRYDLDEIIDELAEDGYSKNKLIKLKYEELIELYDKYLTTPYNENDFYSDFISTN